MSPQTGRPLLQFESRKNFFLKHRGPAPINPPMNADRHAAYVQAKSQLDDLSQSKLLPEERAVLYDAADDLLLTNDPSVARAVFEHAEELLSKLLSSGRWTQTMVEPLIEALALTGDTLGIAELPLAA
jgi:hypothetical protein